MIFLKQELALTGNDKVQGIVEETRSTNTHYSLLRPTRLHGVIVARSPQSDHFLRALPEGLSGLLRGDGVVVQKEVMNVPINVHRRLSRCLFA